MLAAGVVKGLGEVICRHSAFQLGAAGGYFSEPACQTAGRFGGPVNIHKEWFFTDELERAFQAAPETTFVWTHAGHGPAATTRSVLQRNPNLLADLSARTPWIGPGTCYFEPTARWTQPGLLSSRITPIGFWSAWICSRRHTTRPVTLASSSRTTVACSGSSIPALADLIGHGNAEQIAPFGAG